MCHAHVTQMEQSRNMFGSYAHGSFYAAPSFGQPQTQIGPCGTDATPFPTVSADVFYGGGG